MGQNSSADWVVFSRSKIMVCRSSLGSRENAFARRGLDLLSFCNVHQLQARIGVGEVGGCLRRKISPFLRGGTSKTTDYNKNEGSDVNHLRPEQKNAVLEFIKRPASDESNNRPT